MQTIIKEYEIVENASKDLAETAELMKIKLEEIKREYRNLPEVWDGIASEKIVSELEDISKSFNSLNESVTSCSEQVAAAIRNYRAADEQIRKQS